MQIHPSTIDIPQADLDDLRTRLANTRWPGALPGTSIVRRSISSPSDPPRFLEIIGPRTDPRTHGGDPADAFHLIIPALPGYGFSTPVRATGWTADRTAKAWAKLMRRLRYTRYADIKEHK